LVERAAVAGVRRAMPDTPASGATNALQVANALFQTFGAGVAQPRLLGRHTMSNAVYAAMQMTPSVYAGDDEIVQWCRLAADRSVTVLDSDGSLAVFTRDGRRTIAVTDENRHARARVASAASTLALWKTPGHWERIRRLPAATS
jgi:hypothetical protein